MRLFFTEYKADQKGTGTKCNLSGRQQTLHDVPSDYTVHDSVMTPTILENIIKAHPEILAAGKQ